MAYSIRHIKLNSHLKLTQCVKSDNFYSIKKDLITLTKVLLSIIWHSFSI